MIVNDDELMALEGTDVYPDLAVERLFAAVSTACDSRAGFVESVELGLAAALSFFADDPGAARQLTVDRAAAGVEGARRHQHWLERYGGLLRNVAMEKSAAPLHPEFVETAIVAGLSWQICCRMLDDREEPSMEALPDLLEFVLVYYLDPAEANRIANERRSA